MSSAQTSNQGGVNDSQPMSRMPLGVSAQDAADESATEVTQLRILYVEDHLDSRSVVANLLRHCGYEVSVAECAGVALEMLNTRQFDVILSDIGLPDGSGNGVVMLAKQLHPAIIAVALSAFSEDSEIKFSREIGFDHYLTKPVDFHELRSVLKNLGRKIVDMPISPTLAEEVA